MDSVNIIGKLLDIPITDPEGVRQRKLLNVLLASLMLVAVVQELVILSIIVFDLPIHPPLAEPGFRLQSYVGAVASIVLCALVFAINRYWSGWLARLLFVVALAAIVYSNTPDNWILATLTYALSVPIVIASFLMGPCASFVVAGLGSLVISVTGVLLDVGIYVTPIFNLFSVAMLAWFTARSLQRALADLRTLNLELDQRVIERTQELAESLEREQAEASKNQAILEGIADGVIVFDPNGKAIVANPAVTGLLGRPVEEITGHDIEMFMGDGVDADDQQMVADLLKDDEAAHSGLKFRWDEKTLSVSLAPVRDASGQVTGTVIVFRDFTREAEIDRMKSTFVSIASHELRTPLGAILGYSEMLREGIYGSLSDEQQGAVERIVAKTGQLLSLANNLLDQAQMEAGKLALNIAPFTPSDLIDDVQGVMDVLAQARGLELTSHIADDVPDTVYGDRQRLHQILINLIGNALKFTDEGEVSMRAYIPTEGYWVLEVSDTGCGIPQEAQTYIFDPFRQVDDSATRSYGGAGMGLSIVKQLVSLMGGEIWLESEVGCGSTFSIVLPLMLSPDLNGDGASIDGMSAAVEEAERIEESAPDAGEEAL